MNLVRWERINPSFPNLNFFLELSLVRSFKNLKRLLFAGLLVFFFSGCECFCSENTISPAFIGFSKSQIDTVILRRFTPGGTFANLIDTVVITDPSLDTNCCHPFLYSIEGDTTLIFNRYDTIAPIRAGYDWQIFIPATKSTVSISDIESGTQLSCGYCTLPNIVSFEQNGTEIKSPVHVYDNSIYDDGYRIYIRP
jgi:hypothetical protein